MALTFRDTESKASILTLRYHLFQFAIPSKELLSTHSSLYGVRCLVKALKISKESGAKGSFMVVFHFRTCLSPGALGKAPDAGTPQGPTKGRQEAGGAPAHPSSQPGSRLPQLCAVASLTRCRWPTSARLPPRGQPALLQLGTTGRPNASFGKRMPLTRPPRQAPHSGRAWP